MEASIWAELKANAYVPPKEPRKHTLWPAEQLVKEYYERRGWLVMRQRVLDFMMRRDSESIAVEVKTGCDRLSPEQIEAAEQLWYRGIETYVALVICGGHYRQLLNGKGLTPEACSQGVNCPRVSIYPVRVQDIHAEAFEAKDINIRLAKALGRLICIPATEFDRVN